MNPLCVKFLQASILTTAFVIFLLVSACTSNSKIAEQQVDSLQVADSGTNATADSAQAADSGKTIVDTVQLIELAKAYPDSLWDDSLRKYFTPVQVAKIKLAKAELEKAASAADMATFYLSTLQPIAQIMNKQIGVMTPTETSGDDSPAVHWSWFPEYFPTLSSDVMCSECSYQPMINIGALAGKAATTPQPEDDLFFDVANVVYGGSYGSESAIENSGGWYTLVGCDFCSASTLGSGMRYDILQKLEKAAPARALFGAEMDRYMEAVLGVADERFYYEKTAALGELDKMITSPVLNAAQKKSLQDSRKKITGAYFNCAGGDCNWPTY